MRRASLRDRTPSQCFLRFSYAVWVLWLFLNLGSFCGLVVVAWLFVCVVAQCKDSVLFLDRRIVVGKNLSNSEIRDDCQWRVIDSTLVSIIGLLSVFYALNGRKVTV